MNRVLNFFLLCGLASALVPTLSPRAWAQSPESLGRLQAGGFQVDGALQSGDGELPDGSFFDGYEFAGQANEAVTLLLESEDFDLDFVLLDDQGNLISVASEISSQNSDMALLSLLPVSGRYLVFIRAA